MNTPLFWTVQCGTTAYSAATVTVEASSPEEACERAIEEANGSSAWRSVDYCGPTFVDALAPGSVDSPWSTDAPASVLPVPERYLEGGDERIAAGQAHAFLQSVAALGGTPSPSRRGRRCRAVRARLDLLDALIREATAICERTRSTGVEG